VGLATAVFVAITAVAVAWGRLPSAGPSQSVALLVAASMISAAGASSIDVSVRTVARAIVGGASSGARGRPPRVGRTAVLGRPAAVALTLLVEVALVVRAGTLQSLPGRPGAAYRADIVAVAVGVAVLVPLLVSLRVIVRARPRRGSTRVSVSMPARIGGRSGVAVDIGARGLAVRTDALASVGSQVSVVLGDPDADLCVPAVVARVVASDDGRPGRFVLGLRVVVSPPTAGTIAFQRMWVDRTSAAVRERSPWELEGQVTSRQATGPIRVATAVTAVVVALAFAPPYPVSASSPGQAPGTRSALPFAASPETGAPGRAAPGGMIHH
jgi:energy-converting hydrogenase Eha subunit A